MVKNPPVRQEIQVHFWVRNIPWKRKWKPTTIFLPGKFHGQRSLAGFKRVRHELETKQQSSKNTKVHLIPRATLSQGLPYPRSTSSQGPPHPKVHLIPRSTLPKVHLIPRSTSSQDPPHPKVHLTQAQTFPSRCLPISHPELLRSFSLPTIKGLGTQGMVTECILNF